MADYKLLDAENGVTNSAGTFSQVMKSPPVGKRWIVNPCVIFGPLITTRPSSNTIVYLNNVPIGVFGGARGQGGPFVLGSSDVLKVEVDSLTSGDAVTVAVWGLEASIDDAFPFEASIAQTAASGPGQFSGVLSISSLLDGTLMAKGTLGTNGQWVAGAGATGPGGIFDKNGLRLYAAGGVNTVDLDATTGDATFTGIIVIPVAFPHLKISEQVVGSENIGALQWFDSAGHIQSEVNSSQDAGPANFIDLIAHSQNAAHSATVESYADNGIAEVSFLIDGNDVGDLTYVSPGGRLRNLYKMDELTHIGASGSSLGFYGHTATIQQVLPTGAGKTVDDVISALQALGLVKQS